MGRYLARSRRQDARQHFQERGFALAVLADNADAIMFCHGKVKLFDEVGTGGVVPEGQVPGIQHNLCPKRRRSEGKFERFDFFEFVFLLLFLQRLDSGLNHVRQPGLGAKAADKEFDFLAAFLVVEAGFLEDFLLRGDLLVVFRRVPVNFSHALAVNAQGMCGNGIHKTPVVRN